jgi:hypothetical protein
VRRRAILKRCENTLKKGAFGGTISAGPFYFKKAIFFRTGAYQIMTHPSQYSNMGMRKDAFQYEPDRYA